MKKMFLLAAIACVVSCNTGIKSDTLKVLLISNASIEDNFGDNIQKIAAADGLTLVLGNIYTADGDSLIYEKIPANKKTTCNAGDGTTDCLICQKQCGITLEQGQAEKQCGTTLEQALTDEQWDVVAIAQADDIKETVGTVKSNSSASCRLKLIQNWAYANDAVCPAFEEYGRSQIGMFETLCLQSREYVKKYHLGMIPCGTAVQNSRNSFNGENVTVDGHRMSVWFGRYLLACTFYEAITGTPAGEVGATPENLHKDWVELAQSCAHSACNDPYNIHRTDVKPDYVGWYFASLEKVDKIRAYTLPDALTMNDGSKVETPQQWYDKRRGEILEMIETEMYGKAPGKIEGTTFTVVDEDRNALGGKAIRKQIKIDFHRNGQYILALMYLPNDARGKVPVFAGLNFEGNVTINADPDILYPDKEHSEAYGVYTPKERGSLASRWPVEDIIARGYGVITFHTSDVDPDFNDGFVNGVHSIFNTEGQPRKADEWGTISAWAWGLCRVMDYLETDPDVDAKRVSTIGHSRLGKTAILAGARDPRFAMVVSNCSGCCGAALSRRNYGETVESIIHLFPHWFCDNFYKYADDLDSLPFDQHEFLALIAPRPLYVGSAEDDAWADPTGERIALKEAQKVYRFLGLEPGLTGHHIHEGIHDITAADWNNYMDFADYYLKGRK